MPFEIGTFPVTLFVLPQELPENYIDLLNANRAGCIDLVKDEPEIGWASGRCLLDSKIEQSTGALEQSDLHQSAQSGAQDSIFYAKGMVPAGGTGLDARQRTQQRVLETEEAN